MIKKITAIALFALLLTACKSEEKERQVTGTTPAETTVTTPLTLTEIITEETFPEPETVDELQLINLALFNPFSDKVKLDDSLREKLVKLAEEAVDTFEADITWGGRKFPKDTYILSYNEEQFEALVITYDRYTFSCFSADFTTFIKEDDEWIYEGHESKLYRICEYSMLYDILVVNYDKWNAILSGNVDENEPSVIIEAEEYKPADTGMTLDEMRAFFDQNLSEEISEKYKQKYIENIYGVLDGKLYRKISAPKWYLPEAQLDVLDLNTSVWFETGWTNNISYEYTNWIRFDFFDCVTENTYNHGLYLNVKRGKEIFYYDKKNDEPIFPYYEKYIDSELPIKPLE